MSSGLHGFVMDIPQKSDGAVPNHYWFFSKGKLRPPTEHDASDDQEGPKALPSTASIISRISRDNGKKEREDPAIGVPFITPSIYQWKRENYVCSSSASSLQIGKNSLYIDFKVQLKAKEVNAVRKFIRIYMISEFYERYKSLYNRPDIPYIYIYICWYILTYMSGGSSSPCDVLGLRQQSGKNDTVGLSSERQYCDNSNEADDREIHIDVSETVIV